MPIQLNGMTWSHSRGYPSIVAVSQRYEELHPGVQIHWEKRSLAKFESEPVGALAQKYDLLVIDHPWSGFAAASGALVPLDAHMPSAYLADQEGNSVGLSYESYLYGGHLYALPIDGAAPVAVYRPDLLPQERLPRTWEQLLELASAGSVVFAAKPVYTLLDFFMICSTLASGPEQLWNEEQVAERDIAAGALERLRELACRCDPLIFDSDPIEIYERMAGEGDAYAYCPFIYGYSNYCRPGYGVHTLKAADVVTLGGSMLKTTLGGTGLAISSRCAHLPEAVDFAKYAASPEIQRTLFFGAGGQPGHKAAWLDDAVNRGSNDFFRGTLQTLGNAAMRPRYNGYIEFQNTGGVHVRDYMMTGRDLDAAIKALNGAYRASRGAKA